MESHASLSITDLKDIQAGPVVQIPTRVAGFLFFGINDAVAFRKLFGTCVLPHITTSDEARTIRTTVVQSKMVGQMATIASINISFSQQGLTQLGLVADIKDEAFEQGQFARAQSLGDDEQNWLPDFTQSTIHGLFEVIGYPATHVQGVLRDKIKGPLGDSITVIFEHYAHVRPGDEKGHEHFGFNDGISQPYVQFEDDGNKRQPLPGQTVVDPGVLLLGQTGDALKSQRPSWAINGSFLVYRHLKQLVPEFEAFLREVVLGSIISPLPPGFADSDDFQKRVDFLGARLMGRWKSGCPVVLTPKPHGEFPVDNPVIGKDPKRNNNFDYGPRNEDPRQQFLCPFAAHTRKTGPRTDISQRNADNTPGSVETSAIVRTGVAFGRELTDHEKNHHVTKHERGLSFVCYQSALQNGFEFIQQKWSNNEKFPFKTGSVEPGFDPIIGQKQGGAREMTGYDVDDLSKPLSIPKEFVIPQGGEYFFLPSMTTLREIGRVV
jgi:Dyp-type peroxidase family